MPKAPKPLELTFDPNTIDDLGAKLYSRLPPIIAELIANGYDAGASKIHLTFIDNGNEGKSITVADNGSGMSYKEINDNYLVVGRKKRDKKQTHDPVFNRPVMGRKGIGKLSFFGITNYAKIITRKDGIQTNFVMDRSKMAGKSSYRPKYESKKTSKTNGTRITLRNVKRESAFDIQALKRQIANYFIFDKNFTVYIKHNDGRFLKIKNEDRYGLIELQFTWQFPNDDFPFSQTITGKLYTALKPLSKKMRGVTIFSRKKLVNLPELFPIDSSSYFYEYLTGFLEADFIDDFPDDVISTDRKSLSWGHESLIPFSEWLESTISQLQVDWRPLRAKAKQKAIEQDPEVIKRSESIRTKQGKDDLDNSIGVLADADVDTEDAIAIVTDTVEEYQDFHNKNLCDELSDLTLQHYKDRKYYEAVLAGVKRYIVKLRTKINKQDENDDKVVIEAFKAVGGKLLIGKAFRGYENAETGAKITDETFSTMERGNLLLAQAMLAAFRNPIAHQETHDLDESGIYTASDCMDALSLLSHLYRRADNAELS